MVGLNYRFYGHAFKQTLGDSEGQKAVVLESTSSQRVAHDFAAEQQQ